MFSASGGMGNSAKNFISRFNISQKKWSLLSKNGLVEMQNFLLPLQISNLMLNTGYLLPLRRCNMSNSFRRNLWQNWSTEYRVVLNILIQVFVSRSYFCVIPCEISHTSKVNVSEFAQILYTSRVCYPKVSYKIWWSEIVQLQEYLSIISNFCPINLTLGYVFPSVTWQLIIIA